MSIFCKKKLKGMASKAGMIFAALFLFLLTGCSREEEALIIEPVKEEERLLVFTSHKEEIYKPIIEEFEERTGIWVEVECYGTTEALERIRENHGEFTCDVMFGGGIESYNAYSEYFMEYEAEGLSYVKASDKSASNTWTPFSELPIVIIYNKKIVNKNQAPKGFADLFDERWKGSIAYADPLTSDLSVTILSTLVQLIPGSEKTIIEGFVNQLDTKILSSSGDVTENVSQGTFLVGITLEENALKAKALGKNIAIVYPEEGTSSVPDAAAIVKCCKHEENAKAFIDFIISEDVQREISENMYRRSVRTDVEDALGAFEFQIFNYNVDTATKKREFIMSAWSNLTHTEAENE